MILVCCNHDVQTLAIICNRPFITTNIFKAIHDAGGFVKIAFGGENSYNPGENLNQEELAFLVERIKKFVNDFKLDGVEFTFVSFYNFCFLLMG